MTTTITRRLQAAIFSGAVGFLPNVTLADGGSSAKSADTTAGVPDHAEAEARGAKDTTSSAGATSGGPDHAAAEAHSAKDPARSSSGTTSGGPDHAAAERRGAQGE